MAEPIFGGEDVPLTGGRRGRSFFGGGIGEDVLLEGEIEEFSRRRNESVDGDIIDARRWLLSALVSDKRRLSVEVLSGSCEEDIADACRWPISTTVWDDRRSSVETLSRSAATSFAFSSSHMK